MNTKQILSMLLAITFLAVGCKPENYTGSAASNTPVFQQTLRLSEPVQVSLAISSLTLQDVWSFRFVGDYLIATTKISEGIRPVTIDLDNGQVQGLQSPLRIDSLLSPTGRYILRSTSYYNEKIKHQAGELFVYDLQQGKEFQVAHNQPGAFPVVSGNIVAWQGLGEGGWNIYGYDMSTNQTFTVTHGTGTRAYPYSSDDWIIYLGMDKDATLHAYNSSTQETLTLGATPYARGREGKYHLISSGKVIWADAETYDLHVFNLSTRATEAITAPVTTCKPVYYLESLVKNTLLYRGCEGWMLYDLENKSSLTIPVFPPEIRELMAQNKNNEDAIYGVNWIGMSETRLAWTVIDGLGHSWLYTSQIER